MSVVTFSILGTVASGDQIIDGRAGCNQRSIGKVDFNYNSPSVADAVMVSIGKTYSGRADHFPLSFDSSRAHSSASSGAVSSVTGGALNVSAKGDHRHDKTSHDAGGAAGFSAAGPSVAPR